MGHQERDKRTHILLRKFQRVYHQEKEVEKEQERKRKIDYGLHFQLAWPQMHPLLQGMPKPQRPCQERMLLQQMWIIPFVNPYVIKKLTKR